DGDAVATGGVEFGEDRQHGVQGAEAEEEAAHAVLLDAIANASTVSSTGTIDVQASAAKGTVPTTTSVQFRQRGPGFSQAAVTSAAPPSAPTTIVAGAAPAAISSSQPPRAPSRTRHQLAASAAAVSRQLSMVRAAAAMRSAAGRYHSRPT